MFKRSTEFEVEMGRVSIVNSGIVRLGWIVDSLEKCKEKLVKVDMGNI